MKDALDFPAILARKFSAVCELSSDTLSELGRHYDLLLRWNKTLNLTSVTEIEQAVLRHYCESLFLGLQVPKEPVSVLDVGSGAGFPGIPMAVLRPDCTFTLAESHQRKAVFLREATRHLPNVRVAARRAEEVEGAFDWVVSRAVKWPEVLKVARGIEGGASLSVGLLIGQDDAAELVRQRAFEWREPILLPWGLRRVLVVGHVPRGTPLSKTFHVEP
jgi:16S rRNA (guanine527-N7)-methyltransferase